MGATHEGVLAAKQLLARLRLGDLAHADFPRPALAPRHLGAQGPAHNLVPVAHAYGLDPVLRQHFLDEIDQADDPRVVVKGIESCRSPRVPLAMSSQPGPAHPFKPVCRSISRISGKMFRVQRTTPRDQNRINVLHLRISFPPLHVPLPAHKLFLSFLLAFYTYNIPSCNL